MVDNNLLQGIVTAVISSATGAIVVFILPYIARLAARTINFWLIGIILVVLAVGLLYGASLEKISLWWVFGGLLIIILSYGIYKRYFDFPFRKWRVNNNRGTGTDWHNLVSKSQKHDPGLLAFGADFDGTPIGKTWMFKTNKEGIAVYGPYIASLDPGKYKAIFKLKVMIGTEDIKIENKDARTPLGKLPKSDKIDIIKIDVVSCKDDHGWGETYHGEQKTLYNHSFKQASRYQKFKIEFSLEAEARGVEMRIHSRGHGHIVVLDYIKLSRRLP